MKIIKLFPRTLVLTGFLGFILFYSCTDKTSQIGADLVPNGPLSNLKMDTVALNAYTIIKDSVVTSNLSQNLLGDINDPVFGKVLSSIYAQFIPASTTFAGFDGYTLDSVVLILAYKGSYYGDSLTEHTIRVHELKELLDDTLHYSNENKIYNQSEIASHTYKLPFDTLGNLKGSIRIMIDKDGLFANNLWNIQEENYPEVDTVETTITANFDKFFDYFNGLYITVDPINTSEKGSLAGIDLLNTSTNLRFYTTDNSDSELKKQFDFAVINGYCTWFNNFNHFNYQDASGSFQEQTLTGNKELGKEKLYIQPLGGSHVFIDLPDLKDLNDIGNLIINKAELILSYEEDESGFENPASLGIGLRYEDGSVSITPDISIGTSFLGGSIDTANKVYKFRVTRYVQEVLQNKDDGELGLFLFAVNENTIYNRLIFTGFDPADPELFLNRFKLEVTYSVIE